MSICVQHTAGFGAVTVNSVLSVPVVGDDTAIVILSRYVRLNHAVKIIPHSEKQVIHVPSSSTFRQFRQQLDSLPVDNNQIQTTVAQNQPFQQQRVLVGLASCQRQACFALQCGSRDFRALVHARIEQKKLLRLFAQCDLCQCCIQHRPIIRRSLILMCYPCHEKTSFVQLSGIE